MCGIAGYVGDSPRAEAIVTVMTACLAHRGPDAAGLECWTGAILGHRRLAIFDLSAAGIQPMLSRDRSTGIVFNGAIFNFVELRAELEGLGYRFLSRTDTEVILHGYHAWGVDRLVARLRGMFAIAIWDNAERKLTLLRDRLGVKPLVYAVEGGSVAFASTVRAVAAGIGATEIDRTAVGEFLEFGFITDEHAIYTNIRKVPPATIIEFVDGIERRREYWQPSTPEPGQAVSFEEAVDRTEALFLEAVKMRLAADVRIGALLSGGVDSSLVCWAIAKLGGDVRAFTVGTPGDIWDETPDAVQTARQIGIDHSVIEVSPSEEPRLDELVSAYGEPFACASALGMLRVCRAVRAEATVLLTGDGGDDCFLGYPEHKHFFLAERVARIIPSGLAGLWRPSGHRSSLPSPLRRAAHFLDYATNGLGAVTRIHDGLQYYRDHGLLGVRLSDVHISQHAMDTSVASARHLLGEFLAYDRKTRFTGEYLTKVDGGSMYYALEARSPFLDQELWNMGQSLPFQIRLHGGRLKAVLRALAERHLGPRVAYGKKRGFGIPVNRWLSERWKQPLLNVLADSYLERHGWLRASAAVRCLEESSARGHVPNQLWYLYVLESWLRHENATAERTVGLSSLP